MGIKIIVTIDYEKILVELKVKRYNMFFSSLKSTERRLIINMFTLDQQIEFLIFFFWLDHTDDFNESILSYDIKIL